MSDNQKINEDDLKVLHIVHNNPKISQRGIAEEMNFSLGKVNYCLTELKKKGLIKINNFKKNKNKSNYIYLLTPKGIAEKTKITIRFMKEKMREYDELKRDLKDKN